MKVKRKQLGLFARNFLKHPKMLGSVIPSSRFLINMVLKHVDWKRVRVFVEYGPGVGTFTTEVLRHMPRDAVLIAIETNTDFVGFLRGAICDPRLHVVHGCAADVQTILKQAGHEHADYIISGIPFSTFSQELRDNILRNTRAALRPDGAFLVYQFSNKVLAGLKQRFSSTTQDFEPLNIPPARVFYAAP